MWAIVDPRTLVREVVNSPFVAIDLVLLCEKFRSLRREFHFPSDCKAVVGCKALSKALSDHAKVKRSSKVAS